MPSFAPVEASVRTIARRQVSRGAVAPSAERSGMLCARSLVQDDKGAAEALHLLQKLHADRKETEVQLRKGEAKISPNMEEMFRDVEHARPRQEEGMNKPTSAEPPRTAGVPNTRGYQEDQPLDAASATCCALLRPLPQERQPGSRLRRRTRHATNPRPPKR